MTKTWTRVILTIPVEHAPAANRLAHVFDYDSGGGETFGACALSPTGAEPATHYMASTQLNDVYVGGITDPEQIGAALTALAAEYGREPAEQADIDAWCANVIVGEPEGLQRVVPEEPAA